MAIPSKAEGIREKLESTKVDRVREMEKDHEKVRARPDGIVVGVVRDTTKRQSGGSRTDAAIRKEYLARSQSDGSDWTRILNARK